MCNLHKTIILFVCAMKKKTVIHSICRGEGWCNNMGNSAASFLKILNRSVSQIPLISKYSFGIKTMWNTREKYDNTKTKQ